jgi:hypothetical protein
MSLNIESNYRDGPAGINWQETYFEYADKSGKIVGLRPLFIGIDRNKTTPDEALRRFNLSTTVLTISRPSDAFTWVNFSVNQTGVGGTAFFKFQVPRDAGVVTNTLQFTTSAVGQNSQLILQAGINQNAFVVGASSPTNSYISVGLISGIFQLLGMGPAPNQYQACVNVGGTKAFGAQLLVQSNSNNYPSIPTFIARSKSGNVQTGSLTEWQDANNGVLSKINRNGYFMTRKTTAPSDGEIATGELAIWFNATRDAASLQIKARDVGGTIRTGTIALR